MSRSEIAVAAGADTIVRGNQLRLLSRRALLGLGDRPSLVEHQTDAAIGYRKHIRWLAVASAATVSLLPHSVSESEPADTGPAAASEVVVSTGAGLSVPVEIVIEPTQLAPAAQAAETVAVSPEPDPFVPETVPATTLPESASTLTVPTIPDGTVTVAAEAVTAGPPFPLFNIVGNGTDISYPQCGRDLAQLPLFDFAVVGINGGRPFRPNPCLAEQAGYFAQNLGVYVNTAYPGSQVGVGFLEGERTCVPEDLGCMAYNYGYAAGVEAVNIAQQNRVMSSFWWLDTERANAWTDNPAENIESLKGMVDAIAEQASAYTGLPVQVGFYSTPTAWAKITGDWQNGYPNWLATGPGPADQAAALCTGREFTGGPTLMVQYVDTSLNLDRNRPC